MTRARRDTADTETLPAPDTAPGTDARLPDNPLAPLGERFEHLRLLGRGGMGAVYLARDRQLDRPVAVKRIALPPRAHGTRLAREARLAARIEDTNVVRVYDIRVAGDAVYILSEYIEGDSLARVARPVPWTQALAWGLDLARGLAAVHQRGILHRDIKPANAIVETHTGHARLIDFGVATLIETGAREPDALRASTRPDAARAEAPAALDPATGSGNAATPAGARPGTPRYQAPEIWDGRPATMRSDVYALGVLLYELCTGQEPPVVADPGARRDTRVHGPDIDERFAHIVDRCIALDPTRRYASGAELCAALERLQAAPVAPENPYRGLSCFHERHRGLFFGRELDTGRVVERLRDEPFVLLVGDSGAGKSSLAHAGVLPRLREGALDPRRAVGVAAIVPGRRPLAALAHALGHGEHELARAPARAIEALRARHDATGAGLVLFVDQIEELVTVSDPDQARQAQALLAALIERRLDSVRVLAAVRGDHFTALGELPELGALLHRHVYLLRAMDPPGVRAAIAQPALRTGVRFESDELIEHLLRATLRARAGMPLLQFTLVKLWEARDSARGVITRRALDELGGVEGALARYADQALDELPRRAQRLAAQRILVDLVSVHCGTRVRCERHDLVGTDAAAQEALEHLVDRRLVVSHQAEGAWVYAIAHEALLAAWPRLRAWLDHESELAAWRAHLADAAQQWLDTGQSGDALWGLRLLREAERLDARTLSPDQAAFLAASRRALFRKRWLLRGSVAVVIALTAGSYATSRWQARRALEASVSGRVDEATRRLEQAGASRQAYLEARQEAQRGLLAGRNDWPAPWQVAMSLDPGMMAAHRSATELAAAAHALDPEREDGRRLLARALDALAGLADVTGRRDERDAALGRLRGVDGARADAWRAPAPVTIATTPAGAMIEVQAYEWRPDASFGLAVVTPPAPAPLTVELPPGSYLVTVHASEDRVAVRYPLVIEAREDHGAREQISIYRPRARDLPAGFAYVPEGRFLAGYGQSPEQEGYRSFHDAPPLHPRRTGAYLVRVHETTVREWLAYVDACTGRPCPGGAPARAIAAEEDELRIEIARAPDQGWRMLWRPDPARDPYRAVEGQPLIYERDLRQEQDWREFPVTGVSAIEVRRYLAYLREVEGIRGAELCTEAQWERAARGADGRMFPHGNGLAAADANIDITYGHVPPALGPDQVGSHPDSASPFGAHDMAGNVAEMTWPDPAGNLAESDIASEDTERVILRGGAFYFGAVDARSFSRWKALPGQKLPYAGFRVCAAAPVE